MTANKARRLKTKASISFCLLFFASLQVSFLLETTPEPDLDLVIPVTIICDSHNQPDLHNICSDFTEASIELKSEIGVELIPKEIIYVADFDGKSTMINVLGTEMVKRNLVRKDGLVIFFTNNGCITLKEMFPGAPEGSILSQVKFNVRLLGVGDDELNLIGIYETDNITGEVNLLSGQVKAIQVICHEVGHALGLKHNIFDKNSIMYPSCTDSYGKWTIAERIKLIALKRAYRIKQALGQTAPRFSQSGFYFFIKSATIQAISFSRRNDEKRKAIGIIFDTMFACSY